MRKSVLSLLFVLGFVLTSISSSYAVTLPLFGPKKYQRTTGKPDAYSDTVEVCNTGASYSIVVENGEAGANMVSSGTVSINGREIIKQNEFSQQVSTIQKPVKLTDENSIDVKLASAPGSFITVKLICTANCLDVKITTPADQSAFNKTKAIIRGNLYNVLGDTGVTIMSAGQGGQIRGLSEVNGVNFAGITPLQPGANTITATASDDCGLKAVDTVTVNATPANGSVNLTARPASGVLNYSGSFQTALQADVRLRNPVASYSWDFKGTGAIDRSGASLSSTTAAYNSTGFYFPVVTVTDTSGAKYTDTAIVNVLSAQQMDAILRGKWDAMRSGLASGDINKAMSFFEDSIREQYMAQFTALKSALGEISNDMGKVNLVKFADGMAEYEILSIRNGTTYSYYLLFVKDKDGLWKISAF